MIVGEAKLLFRADHARGLHPADDGGLEDGSLAGAAVYEVGAGARERHLLAHGHVWSTAHHGVTFSAQVHGRQHQPVCVRVPGDVNHLANGDAVPFAGGGDDLTHLRACHSQPLRQLLGVKGQVNVFGEPL